MWCLHTLWRERDVSTLLEGLKASLILILTAVDTWPGGAAGSETDRQVWTRPGVAPGQAAITQQTPSEAKDTAGHQDTPVREHTVPHTCEVTHFSLSMVLIVESILFI